MSDLRDLYQELILDHSRRPRNHRALTTAHRKAEGFNPLCGDSLTVFIELDGDVIKEATFEGCGCAISTASASLMTESVKGRTASEAEVLFRKFRRLVTGEPVTNDGGPPLGKLQVFEGIRQYPIRVKCATLAWHTLAAALENRGDPVSTE